MRYKKGWALLQVESTAKAGSGTARIPHNAIPGGDVTKKMSHNTLLSVKEHFTFQMKNFYVAEISVRIGATSKRLEKIASSRLYSNSFSPRGQSRFPGLREHAQDVSGSDIR